VIGELESLTARHPFQERLIAQTDACAVPLRAAGRGPRGLSRSPTRARRAARDRARGFAAGLERAILQQDPALELPTGGAVPQAPRRRRRLIAAGIAASAALAGVAIALVVAGGGGAEDIVDPTQSLGVVRSPDEPADGSRGGRPPPHIDRRGLRIRLGVEPGRDTTVSKIDAATGRLASTIGISERNARADRGSRTASRLHGPARATRAR
jgi:hypothetical protein